MQRHENRYRISRTLLTHRRCGMKLWENARMSLFSSSGLLACDSDHFVHNLLLLTMEMTQIRACWRPQWLHEWKIPKSDLVFPPWVFFPIYCVEKIQGRRMRAAEIRISIRNSLCVSEICERNWYIYMEQSEVLCLKSEFGNACHLIAELSIISSIGNQVADSPKHTMAIHLHMSSMNQ